MLTGKTSCNSLFFPSGIISKIVEMTHKRPLKGLKAYLRGQPVILAPGYTRSPELASELQEHVKRVTAPYKYPREVEFVDGLPKTISGKIRRVELREMERKKKSGK